MTLELKYSKKHTDYFSNVPKEPFLLSGVKEISKGMFYGDSTFEITIFDRKVFCTDCFEYVKDKNSDTYYVKDGKWLFKEECE